jgi:curli biogenesis system outer membrane secretion channel CsgG
MNSRPHSAGARRRGRSAAAVVALVLLAATSGCRSSAGPIGQPARFVRPTVAVEPFENRAPFPLKWDLGDGMAEVLTASLTSSGRFDVVSRASLDSVMHELDLQRDPHFREEGRVAQGRLKNAHYLVKGTVVDFSHVAGGGLHFMRGLVHGSVKGYVALVSITLEVIDVETRAVLSNTFEGQAWASEASVEAVYHDIAFGGEAFYRTPLGHATRDAIWQALHWMVDQVASAEWHPLIARIESGTIYLNGGHDRGMRVGELLDVREAGEPIIDPASGDILGQVGEHTVGRLRVASVADRFSIAEVVSGEGFRIGQSCTRLVTAVTPPPR